MTDGRPNQAVSTALWQQLFDAAPVGLLLFDPSRRLAVANGSAHAAFAAIGCELAPGFEVDHDLAPLLGDSAAEEIARIVEASLRDDARQSKVVRVQRGPVDRLLSVCCRAVRDESGLIGALLSMEDVTAGNEGLLAQVEELHSRVDDLIERASDANASAESTRALMRGLEDETVFARTLLRFMRTAASASSRLEAAQIACDALANSGELELATLIDIDYESKVMAYAVANGDFLAELNEITVDWSPQPTTPGPGARALRSGRPVVIDDLFADVSLQHYHDFYRRHGLHSGAALPVRSGGEIVSLLVVAAPGSPLAERAVSLSEAVAEELGHTIERLGPKPVFDQASTLIDDLPIVLFDSNMEGDYLAAWVSPNIERVTGYSVERFLKEPAFWAARILADERDATLSAAADTADGEVWQIPYDWQCADGSYVPFLSVGRAATRPDGSRHAIGAWIRLDGRPELGTYATEAVASAHPGEEPVFTERLVRDQNERLAEQAHLLEISHDALFVRSWEGEILAWTHGAQQAYGWTAEEAIGKRAEELLQTEFLTPKAQVEATLSRSGTWRGKLAQRTRDGQRIVVDSRRAINRSTDGERRTILVSEVDTTTLADAQRLADSLRADLEVRVGELSRFDTEIRVLGEMAELMQNCPTADEAYSVVRHYLPRLCDGVTGGALYAYANSRDVLTRVESWDAAEQCSEGFPATECWGLRRSRPHVVTDTERDLGCGHAECHAAPYFCVPLVAQGEVTGLLHVCIDESTAGSPERTNHALLLVRSAADQLALTLSNLKLRDRLADMSIQDPLSGLYNRRFMEASLHRELGAAERAETTVSVIMLDLDRFKEYNDTYGHDVGDGVIDALGILLRRKVRPSDLPCRYGGEEFLIVLPGAQPAIAAQRAEILRDAIATSRLAPHGVPGLTASFGVASYPANGRTVEQLLRAADSALYAAKDAGRNRVVVSSDVAEEDRRDRSRREANHDAPHGSPKPDEPSGGSGS